MQTPGADWNMRAVHPVPDLHPGRCSLLRKCSAGFIREPGRNKVSVFKRFKPRGCLQLTLKVFTFLTELKSGPLPVQKTDSLTPIFGAGCLFYYAHKHIPSFRVNPASWIWLLLSQAFRGLLSEWQTPACLALGGVGRLTGCRHPGPSHVTPSSSPVTGQRPCWMRGSLAFPWGPVGNVI